MRIKITVLLLCIYHLVAIAQEVPTTLIIQTKDNSFIGYSLAEEPILTFTPNELTIKTDKVTVNYPLSFILQFVYGNDSEINNIGYLPSNDQPFRIGQENLIFNSNASPMNIAIYSINGQLLFTKQTQEKDEYIFPIAELSVGVYIVKVNNMTYKITIK